MTARRASGMFTLRSVHIDTKPTREEAMELLWSRRHEGTAFDIGL